jgi:hypothetical protein
MAQFKDDHKPIVHTFYVTYKVPRKARVNECMLIEEYAQLKNCTVENVFDAVHCRILKGFPLPDLSYVVICNQNAMIWKVPWKNQPRNRAKRLRLIESNWEADKLFNRLIQIVRNKQKEAAQHRTASS